MIYNDTTNEQGILQDIDFTINTNVFTFPIKDKTRLVNQAMDFVTGIILGADGSWKWDDTNYSDLPIGLTSIVSGQEYYTFDDEHLFITSISVKDLQGNWKELKPTDETRDYIDDINITSQGVPNTYEKIGNSFKLEPKPNYSQSDSIKVNFQRNAQHFTILDTTKEPGFAPHLHKIITFYVAFQWALAKDPNSAPNWKVVLDDYTKRLKDHYTKRITDKRSTMSPLRQNNK